jgi:hypothetical protein
VTWENAMADWSVNLLAVDWAVWWDHTKAVTMVVLMDVYWDVQMVVMKVITMVAHWVESKVVW